MTLNSPLNLIHRSCAVQTVHFSSEVFIFVKLFSGSHCKRQKFSEISTISKISIQQRQPCESLDKYL